MKNLGISSFKMVIINGNIFLNLGDMLVRLLDLKKKFLFFLWRLVGVV